MKVLIINGSARTNGNCSILINELKTTFDSLNVETTILEVGKMNIRGCIACGSCHQTGKCVFDDEVNKAAPLLRECDGLVLVTPVYYASPNGNLISFMDRLFQSSGVDKRMKVGAAFAVARRAGTDTSFDVLNKYFTIAGMPVVSGDYWNNGFGREKGEIEEDKEGLRNARVVARRMTFLMKAIKDAKENYPDLLKDEPRVSTHFIKNK